MQSSFQRLNIIVISKEILDNFRVKTVGSLPLHVKHYHGSIRAGFYNTFKPFFKDVAFVDEVPNYGTSIVITKAGIKHIMTKFDNDGNPVAATCRVKYNNISLLANLRFVPFKAYCPNQRRKG